MSTTSTDRPLRVIQWTTGNIGRRSLHAIIGRPDMELVGVYAHGQDKVGVDAAELSMGILAVLRQRDPGRVVELEIDPGLPRRLAVADLVADADRVARGNAGPLQHRLEFCRLAEQ